MTRIDPLVTSAKEDSLVRKLVKSLAPPAVQKVPPENTKSLATAGPPVITSPSLKVPQKSLANL